MRAVNGPDANVNNFDGEPDSPAQAERGTGDAGGQGGDLASPSSGVPRPMQSVRSLRSCMCVACAQRGLLARPGDALACARAVAVSGAFFTCRLAPVSALSHASIQPRMRAQVFLVGNWEVFLMIFTMRCMGMHGELCKVHSTTLYAHCALVTIILTLHCELVWDTTQCCASRLLHWSVNTSQRLNRPHHCRRRAGTC